jgi:ABC-2 type transport system ATP-binding protein
MLQAAHAIETFQLRKVYGSNVAVDDLTIDVTQGQIFGFLGPNGAGKTTTINMLLGNVFPTSGGARLLGAQLRDRETRRRIGFMPEKFQFHDFLSAEEFLDLHGKLYGMGARERRQRIGETLEMVGLTSRRKDRIKAFSKGMQQRLGLAQAILSDPDLIVLDEPTSALDPLGRRDVRDLLHTLKERGKTVFLNSHLLSEIEMTCDQVAIVKAGHIVRQGSIDALLAAPSVIEIRVENFTPALGADLGRIAGGAQPALKAADTVEIGVSDERIIPELVEAVVRHGGRLMSLIPRRESLEDLFIRVVEGEP